MDGLRSGQIHHPGLSAFAEMEGTPGDFVAAVRRRTRAVVAAAIDLGWCGPPWDMEVLASLEGIRVEYGNYLGRQQDALWTSGRILVSQAASASRRRYSLGHEIVHSLLVSHDEGADFSNLTTRERKAAERELEFLCQVGAAELLMPSGSFSERMGESLPALRMILGLASDFKVSIEAAAHRVVDLAPLPCAMLCARPNDGAEVGRQPERGVLAPRQQLARLNDLVVTGYHATPDFAPVRVSIGEPIPRVFHAYRAWGYGLIHPRKDNLRGNVEQWQAYPELGRVDMQAVPLPLYRTPIEILAFLRRPSAE